MTDQIFFILCSLLKEGSSLMMMMMSTSKNKLSSGKLRNLVSGLDRDVEVFRIRLS
jgi:hypothetical protein